MPNVGLTEYDGPREGLARFSTWVGLAAGGLNGFLTLANPNATSWDVVGNTIEAGLVSGLATYGFNRFGDNVFPNLSPGWRAAAVAAPTFGLYEFGTELAFDSQSTFGSAFSSGLNTAILSAILSGGATAGLNAYANRDARNT